MKIFICCRSLVLLKTVETSLFMQANDQMQSEQDFLVGGENYLRKE